MYHNFRLAVEVAEKLWKNGFRDIDVPDEYGLTPLASFRDLLSFRDIEFEEIELCSWLVQKGAKLHRPQHRIINNDPDPAMDPTELLHTTRALHYVATSIGYEVGFIVKAESDEPLRNWLSRLSKDARLLLATILSDGSSDDCICACSSRGCLASTLMLKAFERWAPRFLLDEQGARASAALPLEYLMNLAGPQSSCWDWLAKEIIRVRTFQELELRHTCCFDSEEGPMRIVKFEEEERAEIQDEDKDKIELLESLLLDFEEHRGAEDLISFLEGYWAVRMDQVLKEQDHRVDEEGLREIGVVLEESVDDDWGSENEI